MRKLVVGAFVTMDGVVQAPGGPSEDLEGDFTHGGWLVPYFDDVFAANMDDWTKRAGGLLLGRKTYEMFAASWPNSPNPDEPLNALPKVVASRTLTEVTWNNSTLIAGDVVTEVTNLKSQEGGELQVHGSGNLVQTLLKHDLVDIFRLWQFPIVVGTGKRLFGEGAIPRSFHLVETKVNSTGAILLVYERGGGLTYGEVEVGEDIVVFDPELAAPAG